jgi:hypothetical protein
MSFLSFLISVFTGSVAEIVISPACTVTAVFPEVKSVFTAFT